MQDVSAEINSGNPVTDVILSDRKKEMEEKGIDFDCDFHYPQDENVNAFDISIILNNALSNAIEAVERERTVNAAKHSAIYDTAVSLDSDIERKRECDRDVAHISLSSQRTKNIFIIETVNDYTAELMIDTSSGLPVTSKPGDGHGFGLANIRRVAGKYLGDMEIGKEIRAGRRCCVLRVMLQLTGQD